LLKQRIYQPQGWPTLIFENSIVGLEQPLYPHETWKRGAAGALLCAGWGRYSIFTWCVRGNRSRLFPNNRGGRTGAEEPGWKKSRTSPRLPVQSSENALEAPRRAALNRPKNDGEIELPR
jgi:hypothetical protein